MWAVDEDQDLHCTEPAARLWKTLPVLRCVKLHVEGLIPTDRVTADVHATGDTINDTEYLIVNVPYAIFFFWMVLGIICNRTDQDTSVVGRQLLTVLK